jgi:hypothetical protein
LAYTIIGRHESKFSASNLDIASTVYRYGFGPNSTPQHRLYALAAMEASIEGIQPDHALLPSGGNVEVWEKAVYHRLGYFSGGPEAQALSFCRKVDTELSMV